MPGRKCRHRHVMRTQQADEELRLLPAWAVGLYPPDECQQVSEDEELAMGSSGSTTILNTEATDATPTNHRPPVATTIVAQTPMASAAALDFPQDPVMAHEVTKVQPVTTAMEDVMRQVVENQRRHHTAICEQPRFEVTGKSATVPQVDVCEVTPEVPLVLRWDRRGEVPQVVQVEVLRQLPNADYRVTVESDFPALAGALNAPDNKADSNLDIESCRAHQNRDFTTFACAFNAPDDKADSKLDIELCLALLYRDLTTLADACNTPENKEASNLEDPGARTIGWLDTCPKRTAIVWDWDDTLCPTSVVLGIAPRGPPPLSAQPCLRETTRVAMNLLIAALQHSTTVVIATNAGEGGVQYSCANWMHIGCLPWYRHSGPATSFPWWGALVFTSQLHWKHEDSAKFSMVLTHVLGRTHSAWATQSVNAGPSSRQWATSQLDTCRTKIVKFQRKPSTSDLQRQLRQVTSEPQVLEHEGDLDVKLGRWASVPRRSAQDLSQADWDAESPGDAEDQRQADWDAASRWDAPQPFRPSWPDSAQPRVARKGASATSDLRRKTKSRLRPRCSWTTRRCPKV